LLLRPRLRLPLSLRCQNGPHCRALADRPGTSSKEVDMRPRRLDRREFVAGCGWSAAALIAAAASRPAAAQPADPAALTIAEAGPLLRSGALSPVDLVRAYLDRIDALDDRVNAFITVTDERALTRATELEAELAAGRWRGPLHGIPIALKDNIDTAGIRTTAASALLADRVPGTDAEVWRRLDEAGAILLGKLNMHEFAYGGTSAITHFGPVHNPWNLDHIPGGSSGGSAAAVAAGLCAAALGTDTLASIRQPAAYCGVAGLKPTHGLASIRGIIPVAESLDHVGPLARTVLDCALVLDAIAGYDAGDPMSIRTPPVTRAEAAFASTRGFRIGLPEGRYFDALDPDIASAIDEALAELRALAGGTQAVTLPPVPDFGVLLAEAYAYHEEFLSDPANHALYDPATLERLLAAGQIPASAYIDARRGLELARNAIDTVFEEVDVLVTPTTPALPERIDRAENPAQASGAESSVRNTAPFNLFGTPTISIPCGFSRSGLPIGLQISGPRLGETAVLALAHAYEQTTRWHERTPMLD
jgi:aspartyl-tRNA(Asn)/glutamyl-tRNA(Gln) amidotransferase subunit A